MEVEVELELEGPVVEDGMGWDGRTFSLSNASLAGLLGRITGAEGVGGGGGGGGGDSVVSAMEVERKSLLYRYLAHVGVACVGVIGIYLLVKLFGDIGSLGKVEDDRLGFNVLELLRISGLMLG